MIREDSPNQTKVVSTSIALLSMTGRPLFCSLLYRCCMPGTVAIDISAMRPTMFSEMSDPADLKIVSRMLQCKIAVQAVI